MQKQPLTKLPKADAALRFAGAALVFWALIFNLLSGEFVHSATAACPWVNPTCLGEVQQTICTEDCHCTLFGVQPGCFFQFIECNDTTFQFLTRCVWQLCNCTRIDLADAGKALPAEGCCNHQEKEGAE